MEPLTLTAAAIALPQNSKIQVISLINQAFISKVHVLNSKFPVSSSTFPVLRWNDAVAHAIALVKFIGECYAIAVPQIQNRLHEDTNLQVLCKAYHAKT